MKKFSLLVLMALFCSIVAGCTSDSNEIDNQVYTLVIGCDRAVDNKIRITIQFPTYKDGGSGGGTEKKGGSEENESKNIIGGTIIETVEASSILEGINLLNTSTTRKISFVHTKAIVFSESMAIRGIGNYLEPIARFREARRIMQVIVCKGSAEEFIRENKTNIGESISKAMELAADQADNSGLFPRVPFQTFYTGVVSPYTQAFTVYAGLNAMNNLEPLHEDETKSSPFIPQNDQYPGELPRSGDRKIEFIGTAIFNGDKMVGILSSNETRFFMMITGQYKKGIITIDDKNSPGNAIPLDLRLGRKPKITTAFVKSTPIITVKLNVEADLGAIQSRIPYEKLDKIDDLNEQIRTMVHDGVVKTINKVQDEYNTDIFGFGKEIAKHFFTVTEFEKYNWLSHFKDATINVEVTANVRRTGLMYHSAPIRYNDTIHLSGSEK